MPENRLLCQGNTELLERYLIEVSGANIMALHFFDECSVVKTTEDRHYRHSSTGTNETEIQRYASNATFTVNLLHAKALPEQDAFDNPVLKDGDLVVMDNCGLHHARHANIF